MDKAVVEPRLDDGVESCYGRVSHSDSSAPACDIFNWRFRRTAQRTVKTAQTAIATTKTPKTSQNKNMGSTLGVS